MRDKKKVPKFAINDKTIYLMASDQINEPRKSSKQRIQTIVIVLLVLICCMLSGLLIREKHKVKTILVEVADINKEKNNLDADLKDLMNDYNNLQTDNEEIKTELEEKKQRIQELMVEAEKHKNDSWVIYKLKKEAATLRKVMKGFVHTIDSLNTLNVQLRDEKEQIHKELVVEKEKTTTLEKEKSGLTEKVRIGARLKALNIYALAQYVKSNGIHKKTTKASKTEKIKCCFTISSNQLAETGPKEIYLRIIDPAGKVLCINEDETNMFDFNGVKGLYSVKKQIIYDGVEMDVCLYWEVLKDQTVLSGEYIVEAYADEMDIGKVKFTLK